MSRPRRFVRNSRPEEVKQWAEDEVDDDKLAERSLVILHAILSGKDLDDSSRLEELANKADDLMLAVSKLAKASIRHF